MCLVRKNQVTIIRHRRVIQQPQIPSSQLNPPDVHLRSAMRRPAPRLHNNCWYYRYGGKPGTASRVWQLEISQEKNSWSHCDKFSQLSPKNQEEAHRRSRFDTLKPPFVSKKIYPSAKDNDVLAHLFFRVVKGSVHLHACSSAAQRNFH